MNTLNYIIKKYSIDLNGKLPVEIPNVGRNDLANLCHELDFKTGVEVGVAGGNYSKILCKVNPQMKVYGVDPWLAYENYTDKYIEFLYTTAKKQLSPFSNCEIMKESSMNAVKKFEDESLDFVYLDANHIKKY